MFFFGLGVALGWDSKDTMVRSHNSALSILGGFLLAKKYVPWYYLAPFASASYVLGMNIVYLSGLIMASPWNGKRETYL